MVASTTVNRGADGRDVWADAVWDARERGISLAASFWSLTRMGVRGAWICLTFVLTYSWKRMREFVEARLERAAEART